MANAGRNQTWTAPPILQDGDHSKGFIELVWRPSFDSGHQQIDDQHRSLFDQANTLLTAMISGRPQTDLAALIDILIGDVVQHFRDEETVLRAAGYTGAEAHAAIHDGIVEQAVVLVDQFHGGTLELGALFHFLAYDVIAAHMLGADREFFPCLKRM